MPDVPIIGQRGRVLHWYPTAIIQCKCPPEPNQLAMVVCTGLNNMSVCGHCGTGYLIQGIAPDGSVHVRILAPELLAVSGTPS